MINGDGVSYIVFQKDKDDQILEVIAFFTLISSAIPYIYRTVDEEVYEAMWRHSCNKNKYVCSK